MHPNRLVRSMGVLAVVVAAGAVVAPGCAEQRMEARRDVKIAALAKYPGDPKKTDTVVAVDFPSKKRLELLNTTDKPILSPIVWVNQTYLYRAATIPARGSVTVAYEDLIEQGQGVKDLAAIGGIVNAVEIQTTDALYTCLGPVRK